MGKVENGMKKRQFRVPAGISVAPVDLDTGEIVPFAASGSSNRISKEIFLSSNIPDGVEWIRADRQSVGQEVPAFR